MEENYDDSFNEFAGEDEAQLAEEISPELVAESAIPKESTQEPADIWDGASDELRNEYDKVKALASDYEHKHKSDVGRVSALQRELNEARAKLNTPQPDEVAAESEPLSLTALDEDMPEIAADVRAMIDAGVKAEIDKATRHINETVDSRLQPFNDEQRVRDEQNQYAALEAAHPDFRDIAAGKDYWEWSSLQPESVQAMAGSSDALDVAAAITLFKNTQPQYEQKQATSDKRASQLAASSSIRSRASSASTPIADNDYDAAFAYFADQ